MPEAYALPSERSRPVLSTWREVDGADVRMVGVVSIHRDLADERPDHEFEGWLVAVAEALRDPSVLDAVAALVRLHEVAAPSEAYYSAVVATIGQNGVSIARAGAASAERAGRRGWRSVVPPDLATVGTSSLLHPTIGTAQWHPGEATSARKAGGLWLVSGGELPPDFPDGATPLEPASGVVRGGLAARLG